MTGEEFLNKVRAIKTITDIHWHIEGKDVLDPDLVKVVFVADGEEIEVTFPKPFDKSNQKFIQNASIALLINKFMEQIGNSFRTDAYNDMNEAVNYSREQIKRVPSILNNGCEKNTKVLLR